MSHGLGGKTVKLASGIANIENVGVKNILARGVGGVFKLGEYRKRFFLWIGKQKYFKAT